jgi:uncharacterized membrane protein
MPSSDAAAPRHERLAFLDAFRGFALILMVLNHTGRWWQDGHMTWPRYYFIYLTMAVAAPIFLFLVGFCLPLSVSRTRGTGSPDLLHTLWKYTLRGGRIILAGLLLNVLVFPEDPFWSTGVLQTIGFSIIVAAPTALFLGSTTGRGVITIVAALLYLSFCWLYPSITAWVGAHPGDSRVLFFEFPPWPWVALVLFGLVPGEMFVEQTDRRGRSRNMLGVVVAGAFCIAWLFAYDWWAQTPNRWTFKRDFILNDHWTPRPATAVWVIGMVFCLMALFYYVAEVRRVRMTWLVTLGQTALFLYFIHHFIVLTLVNQHLHLVFNNWWAFGFANLVLMGVLLGLGRAWIEVKRVSRARFAWLGAAGRA